MHHLSRYRSELMGIAIVLVIIHHFWCLTQCSLLPYIPPLGYCGVDIFLFLSGFGLCQGYGKYRSVFAFYKRRLCRIYPTYLTMINIAALTRVSLSVIEILLLSTTITAYIPFNGKGSFDWFIPAIVLFYLFFPLIYYLASNGKKWRIALLLCSFIPPAIYIAGYFRYSFSSLMVGRIPIFVLGVIAGVLYLKKVPVRQSLINMSVGIAIIGFIAMVVARDVVRSSFYAHLVFLLPFAIIIPGLCFLFCRILDHTPKSVNVTLSFIGGISLEAYLCHMEYQSWYCDFIRESGWFTSPLSQWLAGLFFVVSSIMIGYLLSVFVKFVTKAIAKLSFIVRGQPE